MCYGSGCPHERWDGECGRRFPSDLCMMEYETEEEYQKAVAEQEEYEELNAEIHADVAFMRSSGNFRSGT